MQRHVASAEERSVFAGEFAAEFSVDGTVVAAVGPMAAAFAEHAVQFVDEQVEGLVGVITGDAGDQVGARDFDVAFGEEGRAVALGVVVLEVDAHAHDVIVVAEEAGRFLDGGVAECGRELEMDAAHENFRGEGRVGR